MRNKISIIVPVYHVERYLCQCLDSIINQTYRDLEIILIDDGSPDNCGPICDAYARRDSRIRVIHKKNAGVSAAKNDGMDVATGDWIMFVDPDDWIEQNYCLEFINTASKYPADIIFMGGAIKEYGGDKAVVRKAVRGEFIYTRSESADKWEELLAKVFSKKIEDRFLLGEWGFGLTWNVFFDARFLKVAQVRYHIGLCVYEDVLMNSLLVDRAYSIAGSPYVGYHYRVTNPTSVNLRYFPGRIENILTCVQEIFKYIDTTKYKLFRDAVLNMILYEFCSCLQKDYFHKENKKPPEEIRKELLCLKQNPYVRQAMKNRNNRLMAKRGFVMKYILHMPGVLGLKLFAEILKCHKC